MSEPRRLREGGGPAALLLGSANEDSPSADSFERAAKRLGLVGAVVATSTLGATSAAASTGAAAGATGAGAATKTLAGAGLATGVGAASTASATGTAAAVTATGLSLVAKLVGVAAVGVALTTGVVVATRGPAKPTVEARSAPPEAPSPTAAPAPAPAPVTPPIASSAPDVAPEAPRDEPKERTPAKPTKSEGLRDEVALLDAARSAISRGDTSSALAALGQHAQRFPQGFLRSEAAVLRVEALVRAGRRAEAQAEGEKLLAREPNGPQAQRVRSLLGE